MPVSRYSIKLTTTWLKDYLNLPKSYHGKGGVLLGYRVPITFPKTTRCKSPSSGGTIYKNF